MTTLATELTGRVLATINIYWCYSKYVSQMLELFRLYDKTGY